MTAYGRATLQTKRARWTLEISSVNRKGLDVHLHLPHFLTFLDPLIRKWAGSTVERGNLSIRVSCQVKEVSSLVSQLKNEKNRWEEIASALNLSQDQITLPFLLSQISPQEVAVNQAVFEKEGAQVWKKAAKAWIFMKEQEGRALTHDIHARLKTIEQEMREVEKELPNVIQEHLEKLLARVEELKLSIDSEQLKNEAILHASHDDITEEVVRLKSHMDQMMLYLKSPERSVGRTLDFLAQEMSREIGTIMAKAGSTEIAKAAVRIKTETEKIREQVQNIE